MADKVDECEQETSISSNAVSNENQNVEGSNSSLEKRYSLQEANEIGKEMLESIQTVLVPKVGGGVSKNLEDPYVKAWKYMEESNVLLMLEVKTVYFIGSKGYLFIIYTKYFILKEKKSFHSLVNICKGYLPSKNVIRLILEK